MTPAQVGQHLTSHDVSWAVIGATALAAHGVARSSLDVDLLVTDRRCLDAAFWQALSATWTMDLRRGDHDDPLAGVARLSHGRTAVDIVVGRHAWQQRVIERAEPTRLGEWEAPVVTKADLVLLKLFAGGAQDRWDIESLLAADRETLVADVSTHVGPLPADARRLWAEVSRRS